MLFERIISEISKFKAMSSLCAISAGNGWNECRTYKDEAVAFSTCSSIGDVEENQLVMATVFAL